VLRGDRGIGLATAQAAAQRGAEVTVVSRKQASVDRALAQLPPGSRGRAADLTSPGLVRGLFGELGALDHLVFTAGEPLALMDLDSLNLGQAREFFGLRYFGALAAAQAAVPHLRPGGSITLTTGTAGSRPGPGWAVAASICGAIEAVTRALAVELGPIRVNAVRPGWCGPRSGPGWPRPTASSCTASAPPPSPLQRIGEPADIARAYLYCITQPFATGSVITVDGGSVLA
jgi:NAD(P)-dependent dehydrogenase (short-subunit alcohol dehydrogenase family)